MVCWSGTKTATRFSFFGPAASRPILDASGYDIGPLIQAATGQYSLPPALLLGCLKAESGLDPTAERWGDRTRDAHAALDDPDRLAYILSDLLNRELATDVSFGYAQITVPTAASLGLGTGQPTVQNCLAVRTALFDRATSIDLGARYLAGCYRQAQHSDLSGVGGDVWIASLLVYNAGFVPSEGHPWYVRWAANLANYRAALAWAKEVLP